MPKIHAELMQNAYQVCNKTLVQRVAECTQTVPHFPYAIPVESCGVDPDSLYAQARRSLQSLSPSHINGLYISIRSPPLSLPRCRPWRRNSGVTCATDCGHVPALDAHPRYYLPSPPTNMIFRLTTILITYSQQTGTDREREINSSRDGWIEHNEQ